MNTFEKNILTSILSSMFGLYILIFGIFLAMLEIEIEGEHGWAKKLPTWRKTKANASIGFLRNITGYHTVLFLMILFLNHIIFIGFFGFMGISDEFFILAFHLLLIIYWDFLWFVLNPHFTIKKFRKEHIPWYTDSSWIMGFPMDYWYAIGGSLFCAGFGFLLESDVNIFAEYITTGAIGISIWILLILISPLYHKWYTFMRQ